MRASAFKYSVLSVSLSLATLVIILLPFHAFLTVWAASNFGHYTLFRLWKEFLVLISGLGVIWLLLSDRKLRNQTLRQRLVWLMVAYAALDLAVGVAAYFAHHTGAKALAYGLLDDLRFLVFFIICWVIATRTDRFSKRWYKLLIWPSVLVVVFGLLQIYVLPADVLVHFGYGAHTIPPYETINHNQHYVRILSTLRGANPLGAYLVLPISVLLTLLVRYPKSWNWAKLLLGLSAVAVLIASFSRSAWIGAVLACLLIGLSAIRREWLVRYKLPLAVAVAVMVPSALLVGLALNRTPALQNVFLHTQSHSASPISSDQAHLSAVTDGLRQVAKYPLGEGPGTSGPASVYNRYRPARIPENYFLQVGEESGWLGLALFTAINIVVGYCLWQRRQDALALSLLASLVGLIFVNLLSLAWTDDTLSYIWWGLAGVALAVPVDNRSGPRAQSNPQYRSNKRHGRLQTTT